ncbi:MAG TPA: PHP domain-containing protein [Clostridia bacterium]|nr:PHP domain-containing protein [Clostridia bacterium]
MQSYKYDLHIHTRESSMCGGVYAADIVQNYRSAGYDGIAITDHYFDYGFSCIKANTWDEKIDKLLSGYKTAKKAAQGTGFSVILGMELRFEGSLDDYLVYGFDEEFLREHRKLCKLGLVGFTELIKGTAI